MNQRTKNHRYAEALAELPSTQAAAGRHKCAGCAYEMGYDAGYSLTQYIKMNFEDLPESQAGTIRHKSVHAAFALGYLHGNRKRLSGAGG